MLVRHRPIAVSRAHYLHEPIAPISERYAQFVFFWAKIQALMTFPQLIGRVTLA